MEYEKIVDTSKTLRKLDADEVAKKLGAEKVDEVPKSIRNPMVAGAWKRQFEIANKKF